MSAARGNWWTDSATGISRLYESGGYGSIWSGVDRGTVGRIVNGSESGDLEIKWNSERKKPFCYYDNDDDDADISDLEILTPPIDTNLFKD